ncbi:hypothetical protein WG66_002227 [Moniliophthora roreri]|uniref:Uncharacterized protein n=1 Tax=Moniliophthora roreri TaxID=221103 RepID=A0A0W0GDK9_MONRR|nr:hypothetical protein WG66_002227 [Moniliophthora roreri]
MLTKYDFFNWLGLLSKDDPDAMIDIVPCRAEDVGILLYLPVEDIAWNRDQNLDQPWEPGNFRIIDIDDGYYGCNGTVGASPIQIWEKRQGMIPAINGHHPTCIVQPASSSELIHASKQVIWIVPPGYCNAMNDSLDQDRAQKPENLIQLPSALVDDFRKNKFTIDIVRQNRLITFPGISPEAETLLKSCSFTLEERNGSFLRAHFRLCLWLHCLAGNILPEYEGQIEERMESIKCSDGARVDQVDGYRITSMVTVPSYERVGACAEPVD